MGGGRVRCGTQAPHTRTGAGGPGGLARALFEHPVCPEIACLLNHNQETNECFKPRAFLKNYYYYFLTELPSSYGGKPLPLSTVFGNCSLFEVMVVPKTGKLHITVYQNEINTLA